MQIARGGVHRAVGSFADRRAFAGQQAFVHAAAAINHHAIHWHAFAFAHPHHLAHLHLRRRHIHHRAIAFNARRAGGQTQQRFQGTGRFAPGALFQPFAQQHQGDHRHAGFKIHMAVMRCRQHRPHAKQVGHAGAQRHQHIHIGPTAAQAVPSAAIKPPAHQKLYRRGQRPLPQRRNQTVPPAQHGQHFQRKRQAEQGRQQQPAPAAIAGRRAAGRIISGQLGVVTGAADRLQQGGRLQHASRVAHLGAGAGKVDLRFHPRQAIKHFFNPLGAGCAAHAVDIQQVFHLRHGKPGTLNRRHRRLCIWRNFAGGGELGAAGGKINLGTHPRQAVQHFFQTGGAGRAGHAGNRQMQNGMRHGEQAFLYPMGVC